MSTDLMNSSGDDLVVKVRLLAIFGALLPGVGCYTCIAFTYLFQFEKVRNFTTSDCPGVYSALPPVSYSIGVWEPQRFFWLFVMFAHFPPRLFFPFLYRRLFEAPHSIQSKSIWFRVLMFIYTYLMIVEAVGLVAVSVIDIDANFLLHAIAYAVWLISFNFNMLFSTILHNASGIRLVSPLLNRTFHIKRAMFIVGCALSVSTAFSYPLFMWFCIGHAYVAFSLAEYALVGFNSFFHMLTFWEFPAVSVATCARGVHNIGSKDVTLLNAKNQLV